MRVLRSIVVLAVGFLVALSMSAEAAPARTVAPGYVSSEPEDGAMLDHPPEEVQVTFDEPLDPGSELTVTDECGRTVDDGNVTVQANQMTVGIALTPSGDYTVTWLAKGIAGATGQDTGNFSFMVHHGPACDGGEDGGHGGHQRGNGNNGGGMHEGHEGGGQNEQEHAGHEMTGGSSTDHDAMDHDADDMDHDMSSMDHSRNNHDMDKHGRNKHGGRHAKHKGRDATDGVGARRVQAAPDGNPGVAPNGRDVLVALGLCLALGAVGGWFLRVSGAR